MPLYQGSNPKLQGMNVADNFKDYTGQIDNTPVFHGGGLGGNRVMGGPSANFGGGMMRRPMGGGGGGVGPYGGFMPPQGGWRNAGIPQGPPKAPILGQGGMMAGDIGLQPMQMPEDNRMGAPMDMAKLLAMKRMVQGGPMNFGGAAVGGGSGNPMMGIDPGESNNFAGRTFSRPMLRY